MKTIKDEVIFNEFLSTEQKTHINLVLTAIYVDTKLETILTKFGLDLALFNILRIVDSKSDKIINIKEIQQGMMHKMANTSRLIKVLEDREMIERTPSKKDKRVVNVSMTEKGAIVMEQLQDLTNEFHVEQFSEFSEKELETLNNLLNKARNI